MIESAPWWVYLVALGIVISGYMTIRTAKRESEIDHSFIEQEGNVYMERIEKDREKRNSVESQSM